MTISIITTKQSFECNGSLKEFDFSFPADSTADIKALIRNADGIETELTVTSQYSVALSPDGTGGVLTTVATWATGNTLVVYRETEATQETEYKNNHAFDQDVLESNLDKATMILQEVSEATGRCPKFKLSSGLKDVEIADLVAGKVLKVRDSGDGIDMGATGDEIANAQAYAEAAETAKTGAQTAQNKAEKWAEEAENVEVETGKYSAKHYSAKASESAAGVNLPSIITGDAAKILKVKTDETGYELQSMPAFAASGANADITSMTGLNNNGIPVEKVAGALQLSSFQKARAYLNTDQSVASGSFVKVALDTTSFDTSSIVDTSNHRIKPTKAGYYWVTGSVGIIILSTEGNYFTILSINGSEKSRGIRFNTIGDASSGVSDVIYFDGLDDYVELFVYQNSGSAQPLEVGSAITYLSIVGPF
jgi:hypothetical protein